MRLFHKGGQDAAVNKNSVRADARLSGVQKFNQHGSLGRINRVGIFKNDKRRMPIQLQRDALHLLGGTFCQLFADFSGSGECHFSDLRVRQEFFTDGFRVK